ncbi:MAG: hypothetical protein CSA65_01360 [Proteobacteria bacterium]|nr:MAG: hypothetical protein CSA65_01360 [Pseudomonadota bacterium]
MRAGVWRKGAAVTVWEAASGRWKVTLGHSDKGIVAIGFRSDGVLVTGDGEGHVRFWDIHRGDRYAAELVLGDPVIALACAREAPQVAVTTASGQLVVYDGATSKERWRRRVGHRAVVFSADGKRVISGGDVDCRQQACDAPFQRRAIGRDHPDWVEARKARRRWRRRRISLWRASDGKAERWLVNPSRRGAIASMAASPRGGLLAVSAGPRVHVFELTGRKGRSRKSWIVGDHVRLAFGLRGERLVVGSALYQAKSGQKLPWLPNERFTVEDVAVASGQVALAVSERRGLLRTRGAVLAQLPSIGRAKLRPRWLGSRARIDGSPRLAFEPKGERLLVVRGRRLLLWRPGGDAAPQVVRAPRRAATVAWAPSGETFAVGYGQTLELRSAKGSKVQRVKRFNGVVEALAYRPDGVELAVGVGDDVLLLDAVTLNTRGRYGLHDRAVRGLSYDRKGKRLLSFSRVKHARLWQLPAEVGAQPRRLTQAIATGGPLWSAAIAPTGERFLTSRWVDLQLWGDRGAALGQPVKVGGGVILATAISPTGDVLASGDDRGVVRLWSLASGATLKRLRLLPPLADRIAALAFAPDGARLAASDAAGVTILRRVADGELLARLVADGGERWLVERGARIVASTGGDELVFWKVGAHVLPGWFRQAW